MRNISELLNGHSGLLAALKGLPSEELFTLHEEIELAALARIEEEEVARMRQARIAEFNEMLTQNGITPEELLAFTRGSIRASKRNR
jgi:DNA-binding protein H-NS